MEPANELKETIELDLDEEHELLFKVQVEGADAPARVRLVCEGDDISYMFDGHPTEDDGVVQFLIPEMKNKMKEQVVESKVEVLIGNKFFAPVQFGIHFKQATKVFAEAFSVPQKKTKVSTSVSAAPVIIARPKKKRTTVEVSKPKPARIFNNSIKPTKPKDSLQERWARKQSKR